MMWQTFPSGCPLTSQGVKAFHNNGPATVENERRWFKNTRWVLSFGHGCDGIYIILHRSVIQRHLDDTIIIIFSSHTHTEQKLWSF